MEQLLREFWAAFKWWQTLVEDRNRAGPSDRDRTAEESAWWDVQKIQRRIEAMELAANKSPVMKVA